MDTLDPKSEIDFIKNIVAKTSQRVDAQAYHVVHWGLIVLIWYPLQNYFASTGNFGAVLGIGIGSVVLGMLLSGIRGARSACRLPGGNAFIGRQLILLTCWCIGGGFVLSGVLPSTILAGQERNVSIVWGLVYANLAFMMGIVTHRDFVIAGVVIFAGSIVAMFLDEYAGYILGPVMGLGMIIPGRRAEARVKQMMREGAGADPSAEVVA